MLQIVDRYPLMALSQWCPSFPILGIIANQNRYLLRLILYMGFSLKSQFSKQPCCYLLFLIKMVYLYFHIFASVYKPAELGVFFRYKGAMWDYFLTCLGQIFLEKKMQTCSCVATVDRKSIFRLKHRHDPKFAWKFINPCNHTLSLPFFPLYVLQ
jgi:hypothetical protein